MRIHRLAWAGGYPCNRPGPRVRPRSAACPEAADRYLINAQTQRTGAVALMTGVTQIEALAQRLDGAAGAIAWILRQACDL